MQYVSRLRKINSSKSFHSITNFVIILCVVLVGIEINYPEGFYSDIFYAFDALVILYFLAEITIRAFSLNLNRKSKDYWNEMFWFVFDAAIVFFSLFGYLLFYFDHPEAISLLRLFRISRLFRLFEISTSLKMIEKKIIAVVPTVLTFASLLFLIVLVYAVLGMHFFKRQVFDTISFADLYSSIKSLFIAITNSYSSVLADVTAHCNYIPHVFIDFYFISFYVFSVLVTLNIFVSVMTHNIEEELRKEIIEMSEEQEDQSVLINEPVAGF
jgi:voltage-gated sodium channel